jgi:anti-sigma factor RsiW
MNCQTCREQMAELADARLDEKASAEARAHIAGCAACAASSRS